MNKLERIALVQLKNALFSAMDKVNNTDDKSFVSQRLFLKDNINDAIEICRAYEESNSGNIE